MKKFTLTTLFVLLALAAAAKVVTQQQAMKIAENFLHRPGGSVHLSAAQDTQLRLAHVTSDTDGRECLYVFGIGTGSGYVIVSADDCAEQILGYSDNGSFDAAAMPESMRSWLTAYADEISQARRRHLSVTSATYHYDKPVSPLLGDIQWNQDSPFNDLCPVYDISSRCATGCVATAMAQVMYYHRWPVQGTGSHTYSPSILNGKTLTADFASTTYAWDDMLPRYDKTSAEASCQAVAQLMLHCGIAVDMEYSSSSGAASMPVATALATYFGYDKGVAYRTRQYYGSKAWQDIIVSEIDHGRPVIALGMSSSGGHCFVFDGYDREGLIHVNWGWSGMSNGYFRTSALTPSTQGIGGSDGGFNYNQYIVTGIQRPTAQGADDVEIVTSEGLIPSRTTVAAGETFDVALHGYMFNAGWKDVTVNFGLSLTDADGNVLRTIAGTDDNELQQGYQYNGLSFDAVDLGTLADGSYRLYPVARSAGEGASWQQLLDAYVGYPSYLNVTVSDGRATLSQPEYFCLNATSLTLPAEFYTGKYAKTEAILVNDGDADYLGDVQVAVISKTTGRIVKKGTAAKVDLAPGAETRVSLVDAFSLTPGDYLLTLVDDDERHLCNSREITVLPAPDDAAEIATASQLAPEGKATRDSVTLTTSVRCDKGVFAGYAYLFILNEGGTVQQGCLDPLFFSVKSGETADLRFSGPFENGLPGTTYQAVILTYDGTSYAYLAPREMASCSFTLDSDTPTAIADIASAIASGDKAEVYTTDGIRIGTASSLDSLPRGTYLIRVADRTVKFCKK